MTRDGGRSTSFLRRAPCLWRSRQFGTQPLSSGGFHFTRPRGLGRTDVEGEDVQDEVPCAGRDHRGRRHGRRSGLSPAEGRLERRRADREGGADLRLDLARGGPDRAFHRQLQHGQGPLRGSQALLATGSRDRAGHRLARLRRHPPRHHERRGRLVPRRQGHAGRGGRRMPPDRPERDQAAEPLARSGRRDPGRLHAERRPHRPGQLDQRHGHRRPPGRRRDLPPQPRDRHQPDAERRVGGGDREGHHRRRARGQRRRLLQRPGAADGRAAAADREHDPPVPGDGERSRCGGPAEGDAGHPRPRRVVLLPPGAEGDPGRPLRDDESRGLGARRHRLGLRHGAASAGPRPPGDLPRACHGAHPRLRRGRHQARGQRPHHPHTRRQLPARPGA